MVPVRAPLRSLHPAKKRYWSLTWIAAVSSTSRLIRSRTPSRPRILPPPLPASADHDSTATAIATAVRPATTSRKPDPVIDMRTAPSVPRAMVPHRNSARGLRQARFHLRTQSAQATCGHRCWKVRFARTEGRQLSRSGTLGSQVARHVARHAPRTLLDMAGAGRRARVEEVHELARALPHVTVELGSRSNPIYQVGGKSFIFFRTPRPDAVDPVTGERLSDVIVFWVASEADKQALVQDESTPFFTTAHFDGHPSVLLRASRIDELTREELVELVQDAWLSRASARRAQAWLSAPSRR